MAFVLSSVSGNLISAASAGYAPTNSADVSAIASAYQVVSATGTQLYAGTTYVTSVNEAPISADRAGRAGNATLATSAYYDTNARFISALPDSAAVSAIASAYAESAASSKQDTLAFAYNTADQISSINGSALGGMDEAAVSGIASAYAESAASGCIPTSMSSDFQQVTGMSSYVPYSSIGYNTASAISGINGSALAGTTYSAGTGIDITDDVISVEAPVDIVAGPGIVIDNPDGNTLRVSTNSNYETVLWSGSANLTTAGTSIALSEPHTNFERVKIYGESWLGWSPTLWCEVSGATAQFTVVTPYMGAQGDAIRMFQSVWTPSGSNLVVNKCKVFSLQGATASTSNPTNTWARLVVGINRTASN